MASSRWVLRRGAVVLAAALVAATGGLAAQSAPGARPHWLAFRGDLGTEIPRGDPDRVFQGNIRGEFSILFAPSCLRPAHFGVGFGWVSYPIEPGFEEDEQWNHVGLHLIGGLTLKDRIPLPLYLEGRVIERRLRPINKRFWDISADDPIKAKPFEQRWGVTVEGVVGLELPMTDKLFMDMAARFGDWAPQTDLTDLGLINLQHGWMFGMQLGLLWFP